MNNTTTKTIYSFSDKMFPKSVIFGHFHEKNAKNGRFLLYIPINAFGLVRVISAMQKYTEHQVK